jgi:hypothetical protein
MNDSSSALSMGGGGSGTYHFLALTSGTAAGGGF